MVALSLWGIAFVGTLIWIVNPEIAAGLYAIRQGWQPLAVGILAASGQLGAQALLFAFGDQLRRSWRWFDRQCERVRLRYGDRLNRNVAVLAASSGLVGVPPSSVTATLAPGLGFRAAQILPLLFIMRIVRFTVVAALAAHVHGTVVGHQSRFIVAP